MRPVSEIIPGFDELSSIVTITTQGHGGKNIRTKFILVTENDVTLDCTQRFYEVV